MKYIIILISACLVNCAPTPIQVSDTSTDLSKSSLVITSKIRAGENCANGGIKIGSGFDVNKNNILDPDEISHEKIVCHGNNGYSSLISIDDERPGANCTAGGKRIQTGIDSNYNNRLDASEIDDTNFICSADSTPHNQLAGTILCYGTLENFYGIGWGYDINIYRSGDLLVTGTIIDSFIQSNSTRTYAPSQAGSKNAAVSLVFDLVGDFNYGLWRMVLDRNTLVVTITYDDPDYQSTWTANPDKCVKNVY